MMDGLYRYDAGTRPLHEVPCFPVAGEVDDLYVAGELGDRFACAGLPAAVGGEQDVVQYHRRSFCGKAQGDGHLQGEFHLVLESGGPLFGVLQVAGDEVPHTTATEPVVRF